MANPLQLLNPFTTLKNVRRDFDRLAEHFFGKPRWPQQFMAEPAIDSFIEGDKLIVRAQLPGVEQKDLDVTISGNLLTIRSREELSGKQERDFIHQEIRSGKFERVNYITARNQRRRH